MYHGMSDYCISITKKSDRFIKVIYHAMSLTTALVSLRRGICLSLIYHAMSLTRITLLSDTDTVVRDISLFLVILTVVRDIA
jgi:hypothetical protein